MNTSTTISAVMLVAAMALGGCASKATSAQPNYNNYGAIESIESSAGKTGQRYAIRVRLDSGAYSTVVQDSIENLRNGDRVRLVEGHAYRY